MNGSAHLHALPAAVGFFQQFLAVNSQARTVVRIEEENIVGVFGNV